MLNRLTDLARRTRSLSGGAIRRVARQGWAPRILQGGVRSLAPALAIPMRGLVVGLRRPDWERAAAAFPDWDFTFARRVAGVDEIVGDLTGEGRQLVVSEGADRRVLDVKIRAAGVATWHLSRAPVPHLAGAEGFLLEAGASWRLARRTTEIEWLARSGVAERLPELTRRVETLRRTLAPDFDPAGPALMVASDGRRLSAVQPPGRTQRSILRFDAHLRRSWWSQAVQDELAQALTRCSVMITDGHPVAARAALLGMPTLLTGPAFWSGFERLPAEAAAAEHGPVGPDMVLATLMLSRYVLPDGALVDPLFPREPGA